MAMTRAGATLLLAARREGGVTGGMLTEGAKGMPLLWHVYRCCYPRRSPCAVPFADLRFTIHTKQENEQKV